jgi:hypothetical protein
MEVEPGRGDKKSEIMGYARPMNALWLAVLFAATWAFWSLPAAFILLGLLIAATVLGFFFRKKQP